MLDEELESAGRTFTFLIFAVFVVAIGGWFTACAIPLYHFK